MADRAEATSQIATAMLLLQQLQDLEETRRRITQTFNALATTIISANLRFNTAAFQKEKNLYRRYDLVTKAIANIETLEITNLTEKQAYKELLLAELRYLSTVMEKVDLSLAHQGSPGVSTFTARMALLRTRITTTQERLITARIAAEAASSDIARDLRPLLQLVQHNAQAGYIQTTDGATFENLTALRDIAGPVLKLRLGI